MATELSIGPGVATPDGLLVRVGGEWVEAPATITPLGEALRNLCVAKLAVIAERRRTRAAKQEHLSRWDEIHEIAAEVYNADPHDDLTWREEYGIPY
jgi:hypothetical protein